VTSDRVRHHDLTYGSVTSEGVESLALLEGCGARKDRILPSFVPALLRWLGLANPSLLPRRSSVSASRVCITGSAKTRSIGASCTKSRRRKARNCDGRGGGRVHLGVDRLVDAGLPPEGVLSRPRGQQPRLLPLPQQNPGSSSSLLPPFACITPSTLTWIEIMNFMVVLPCSESPQGAATLLQPKRWNRFDSCSMRPPHCVYPQRLPRRWATSLKLSA